MATLLAHYKLTEGNHPNIQLQKCVPVVYPCECFPSVHRIYAADQFLLLFQLTITSICVKREPNLKLLVSPLLIPFNTGQKSVLCLRSNWRDRSVCRPFKTNIAQVPALISPNMLTGEGPLTSVFKGHLESTGHQKIELAVKQVKDHLAVVPGHRIPPLQVSLG